jgi:co-chaperonin GroES (HSP10)
MNTPAFVPGGSRYLVLPDPIGQATETIGGITLTVPKDPNKQAIEGTVVAKGKSCINYELGDKVMYGQFSGYDLHLDSFDYKVLQENELLGQHLITPFDDDQDVLPLVMGEIV